MTGFAFECIGHLAVELADNLLVKSRGRGRFSDIDDAIDQLLSMIIGPCQVFAVGVVLCVALGLCLGTIVSCCEPIVSDSSPLTRYLPFTQE